MTIRIEQTSFETTSDAQGQFRLTGIPLKPFRLIADGRTVKRVGTWPTLEYDMTPVPGIDNSMTIPVYLLPIDIPQGVRVSETEGATLTLKEIPGFELNIAAGSAIFPDGAKSGIISVTPVHADKVPMSPQFGQQPRLIVTIQPAGVQFNPPAKITLPNVDGLAPNEITELYSFDHDAGRFVSIGPGVVSKDGSVITSEPGVGIIKGGWHCGGNPQPTGTAAKCLECEKCDGSSCVPDPAKNGTSVPPDACCFQGSPVPKSPIADLAQCPNRVANPDHVPTFNGCTIVPENPNDCAPDFTPACNKHDV